MREGATDKPALEKALLERYDRQLRVEGWRQDKLTESTVMIVGVGAIGCEVAKNLALMGVGRLVLVDNDVVEVSNLSRQMLFIDEDIGKPKAKAAAEKLAEMNPWVKVEAYYEDVRELDLKLFEESDVLCSCLDNWPVRRWLNSVAIELDKPLVDAAMEGMYANLQVVIPGKTACLECHGEDLIPKEVQLAECTLRRRSPEDLAADLREQGVELGLEAVKKLFELGIKTVFDLKYSQTDVLEKLDKEFQEMVKEAQEKLKPKMPALQSIAAAVAGIASTEVIKLLHEGSVGKPLRRLLVYDGFTGRFTRVRLDRRSDCFVCGDYVREEGATFTAQPNERILDLKKKIAERFGFPDPELLYKKWKLRDEQTLEEAGVENGDVIYVETSRRFTPLPLRIELVEDAANS